MIWRFSGTCGCPLNFDCCELGFTIIGVGVLVGGDLKVIGNMLPDVNLYGRWDSRKNYDVAFMMLTI